MPRTISGVANQMGRRRASGSRRPLWRFMYILATRSKTKWPVISPRIVATIGAKKYKAASEVSIFSKARGRSEEHT